VKKFGILFLVSTLAAVMIVPFGWQVPRRHRKTSAVIMSSRPPRLTSGLSGNSSVMKGSETQVTPLQSRDITGTGTLNVNFTYSMNSMVLSSHGEETFTGTVLGQTGH